MQTLTKKQRQVYDCIVDFIEMRGYSPSYGEIATSLGLSSASTIHVHVNNLVNKGYLTNKWSANRSIDVTEFGRSKSAAFELPLAGRIAAGTPIEAIEDQDTIAVPPDMVGKNMTYALQVNGDSMIEDHVLDGDYVIVEKRDEVRNGDMVVALIRGSDATLKRFRRAKNKVILEPANPVYKRMILDEEDVNIQGVVIGILRKYGR